MCGKFFWLLLLSALCVRVFLYALVHVSHVFYQVVTVQTRAVTTVLSNKGLLFLALDSGVEIYLLKGSGFESSLNNISLT